MLKTFLKAVLLVLFLCLGNLAIAESAQAFSDVPSSHRYYKEIRYLVEAGVIEESSLFGVNRNATRAEIAVMIAKAKQLEPSATTDTFTDLSAAVPNRSLIQAASEAGILFGYKDGTFKPNQPVTRGEMAAFIARAFTLQAGTTLFKDVGKRHSAYDAVNRLAGSNITYGYPDNTFKPAQPIIRGQVAAFLSRALHFEQTDGAGNAIEVNGMRLGDSRAAMERKTGPSVKAPYPDRGLTVYTYYYESHNQEDLLLVAYNRFNKAEWIYTNRLPSSIKKNGKYIDQNYSAITAAFGDPSIRYAEDANYFYTDNYHLEIYYEMKQPSKPVRAIRIIRPSEQSPPEYTQKEKDQADTAMIFDVVNSYRQKEGEQPLVWDSEVAKVAKKHADDMYRHKYFSHTSLDGRTPADRFSEWGIRNRYAGENIAFNYQDGIEAAEGWMNSKKGHRENMLDGSKTHIGIGVTDRYYVQNFGRVYEP